MFREYSSILDRANDPQTCSSPHPGALQYTSRSCGHGFGLTYARGWHHRLVLSQYPLRGRCVFRVSLLHVLSSFALTVLWGYTPSDNACLLIGWSVRPGHISFRLLLIRTRIKALEGHSRIYRTSSSSAQFTPCINRHGLQTTCSSSHFCYRRSRYDYLLHPLHEPILTNS